MPRKCKQVQDLALELTTLVDPDGQGLIPELYVMACAALALPEGEYWVYDDQEDVSPVWFNALPQEQVADWSGTLEHSLGYGGISRVRTNQGVGLLIWLAGSRLASASSIWIMPMACLHVVGL